MNDNGPSSGLGPYAGGAPRASRPTPRVIAQMLKKKIIRAQLAVETARIEEALVQLDEGQAQELVRLMSAEADAFDKDIDNLRAAAERQAREEAQSRDVRPLSVPLSRTSSRYLQHEIHRRLANGYCPDLAILTEIAIRTCYGE